MLRHVPRGAVPFAGALELRMQAMVFEIWEDGSKRWNWRLLVNGQPVAQGESYRNEKDCMWAISLVKSSADAPVTRVAAPIGRDAAE